MAWRTAGRLGWGDGLDLFFPSRLSEPSGLKEGVGHHCPECVAMQRPGSSFEVVAAKLLLLSLLMGLFADQRALMAPI
jgi:hypothetical protein